MLKLCQQSKLTYLENEAISQVLEFGANTVVVSTMSCRYYKVNLKTGTVEASVNGCSKHAVDLIRAPIFDKPMNPPAGQTNIVCKTESEATLASEKAASPKYCGIEANCIVLVDFEKGETKKLQEFKKTEFKSPWYSATFFLKDKYDFLVVGDEQLGSLRCFQIQNSYVDSTSRSTETV
jgi:hypothetical protein